MRLIINIKTKKSFIPFDYQHLLTGVIHKWLGNNREHGKISLYSFSNIKGGNYLQKGIEIKQNANFFFNSHNPELIKQLIIGIKKDPEMFYNLYVNDIIIQDDPDLSNRELFTLASPILIKRKNKFGIIEHITFKNKNSSLFLTESLKRKMQECSINDETLEILFDSSYPNAKTTISNYKGINNRVNWCPVLIKGSVETKIFAWNVGLGNSSGIGYGSIN